MATRVRRAVVVHRPTDYELLIGTHGTRGQAEFFLRSREQSIAQVEADHAIVHAALTAVLGRIPSTWRRTSIARADLSRFLFEPDDVIVAVGQDGLVANVAKYLTGQPVVGINPTPERFEGVLVRHVVPQIGDVLRRVESERGLHLQARTMVEARLEDGQSLIALNEVFLGHRTHQSARYRIEVGGIHERQSSSGLICCSGTGATGWASSIHQATLSTLEFPKPSDPAICYLVREAWPSKLTQTRMASGLLRTGDRLVVTSEMNQDGVIFGDGIEEDYLRFDWGRVAKVGIAEQKLSLVV